LSFKPPSEQEEIKALNDKIEEITDNQIYSIGSGETPLTSGTFGRRNTASGRDDGIRANTPRIHQITQNNVDSEGLPIPTGVFNRLNVVTTLVIVDDLSQPNDIPVKYVNGLNPFGSILKITPKKDRTLTIETGGDFDITSPIAVNDKEIIEFIFLSKNEIGVISGIYKRVN